MATNNGLEHVFLPPFFNVNSQIADFHIFQTHRRLHQLYRVCISFVLVLITIPLMCISFACAVVNVSIQILISCYKMMLSCIYHPYSSRHIVLRVICAMFIPLTFGPLCFLCCLGSAIIVHVKHCYRFHRYVGSSDKKSDVLFHDDGNGNIFLTFERYLVKKLVLELLLGCKGMMVI